METESLVERAAPRAPIPSGYRYLFAKIFYLAFFLPLTPHLQSPLLHSQSLTIPLQRQRKHPCKIVVVVSVGMECSDKPQKLAGKSIKSVISKFHVSSYISLLSSKPIIFCNTMGVITDCLESWQKDLQFPLDPYLLLSQPYTTSKHYPLYKNQANFLFLISFP